MDSKRKLFQADKFFWIIILICLLPLLINIAGFYFGFVDYRLDSFTIKWILQIEQNEDIRQIFIGKYIHLIFVSTTITIACLTALLGFIDYSITRSVSTPVMSIALFCSGLLLAAHLLFSTHVINLPGQQYYFTSYTWLTSRVFHAGIISIGMGIFLLKFSGQIIQEKIRDHRIISYSTILFLILTIMSLLIITERSSTANLAHPFRNIARREDLIPLCMYIFLTVLIIPKFHKRFPSIFSKSIYLSMIPALVSQLYMMFGSTELYDNSFNISHLMMAFSFFIPFTGLCFNYVESHRNEIFTNELLLKEFRERKETELTLQGVMNSSPDAIFALEKIHMDQNLSPGFLIKAMNPASLRNLKLNYKNYSGELFSNIIPHKLYEELLPLLKQATESGEHQLRELYSEDFSLWFMIVCVPLENGVALTISDISDRKKASQELLIAEKMAVTGRIARMIAHEIRNPLTNINLSVNQLRDSIQIEDNDGRKLIEIIERASSRINLLVSELLLSSKPSELQLSEINLEDLINEAINLASDRARLKNVNIEQEYSEKEIHITADKEKLQTAILNLIMNAIEAVEENTGKIIINCSEQNGKIKIVISDNGSGIDPGILKHLFEPFNTGKRGGIGLGLAAVQNIITAHKGEIKAESSKNGTRFIILLETHLQKKETEA
ncbi:MAG: GHKL domain-containing protein [Bacteroidetes bacterium]|nr:MAG: GHKL domain-containing protein [Bacteroidota bacterium]REK06460.1 MAG: GHKL domain-containing protein [Bacteroidota bacterium]REK33226.1 MAG: GHKL domain-containing protein [Bacteroidota bacterium]REK47063.1 MAG: GHKL domain-containing protein [Bacteroidota bacterium]